MTLHLIEQWQIPAETIKVARAAFPKGNVYMKMYEQLGQIYVDSDFASLYPARCGQLALSPSRLALITVMQFAEGLSDRQAAEAVRSRIDWKYALGLELTDSGFDHSVLPEWRERLIVRDAQRQLLDKMLAQLKEQRLLKSRGKQRTDSTHILAAIRQVNRLELVGETLRYALNELATVAPQWLKAKVTQDWFDRYGARFEQYRLPPEKAAKKELALTIGADGHQILSAIYEQASNQQLRQLNSVEILRQVWVQQYAFVEGELIWREPSTTGCPPNKISIESPYDPEARNRTKRHTNWTGYTVHLTETCDENSPNLITNVETTQATAPDGSMTQTIHESLSKKDLLPEQHLLDMAYVDAEHLVTSRHEYEVELPRKVPGDSSWQARTGGFDLSDFALDWDNSRVKCPTGQLSNSWRSKTDNYGHNVIEVRFDRNRCAACFSRSLCTTAKKNPRLLKFRHREQYEALQAARVRQTTTEFKRDYGLRAGVEGTISQGTRAFDLRRTRYVGLAKTHLQHVACAAAMNLSRLMAWWQKVPQQKTRISAFATLGSTA
ncbi:MAG: IS1182 family transposase [Coleofasciculus sp. C1-SOL-03]|uniref:IS1182 family transposase n=1 Tax=Coleofasciculus sp. C1-SOL-03 TaxID=3069522 RepID=UPI0033004484